MTNKNLAQLKYLQRLIFQINFFIQQSDYHRLNFQVGAVKYKRAHEGCDETDYQTLC